MGYSLYIERDGEISIDEWRDAVHKTERIKIDEGPLEMKNPGTGELICIQGVDGDVSVRFVESKHFGLKKVERWEKAISFSHGRGIFYYSESLESPKNELRIAIAELAKRLLAEIRGEGDEIYDW